MIKIQIQKWTLKRVSHKCLNTSIFVLHSCNGWMYIFMNGMDIQIFKRSSILTRPFISIDNWKLKCSLFSDTQCRFHPRDRPPDRHGGTVRGWQMPVERKPLANDRSPVFFSAYRPTPPLSDLGLIRHTGCCEMEYVMSTRHSCFRPAPIIGNR